MWLSLGLRQIRDIPGTGGLLQSTTSSICPKAKDPDASINSRFLDLGPLIRTVPPSGESCSQSFFSPMGTENKQYASTCLISFTQCVFPKLRQCLIVHTKCGRCRDYPTKASHSSSNACLFGLYTIRLFPWQTSSKSCRLRTSG